MLTAFKVGGSDSEPIKNPILARYGLREGFKIPRTVWNTLFRLLDDAIQPDEALVSTLCTMNAPFDEGCYEHRHWRECDHPKCRAIRNLSITPDLLWVVLHDEYDAPIRWTTRRAFMAFLCATWGTGRLAIKDPYREITRLRIFPGERYGRKTLQELIERRIIIETNEGLSVNPYQEEWRLSQSERNSLLKAVRMGGW